MENLNEMLATITNFLKNELKTESLVGQPFKLGEYDCVPVISLGFGFGAGSFEPAKGTRAGGGAGVGMSPIGFLVSNGKDVHFVSTRTSKGVDAVIEKIPELLEKYIDKKQSEKAAGEAKKSTQ